MGKQPSSTTQNTFPPWLMSALQPLIKGSTERMGQFQNQGWNVLQGKPPGTWQSGSSTSGGGGKLPPWLEEQMMQKRKG